MTDSTAPHYAVCLSPRSPDRETPESIEHAMKPIWKRSADVMTGIIHEEYVEVRRGKMIDGEPGHFRTERDPGGWSAIAVIPMAEDERLLPLDECNAVIEAGREAAPEIGPMVILHPDDLEVAVEMGFLPAPVAAYLGLAAPEGTPRLVAVTRPRHEARLWAEFYRAEGQRTIPLDPKTGIPRGTWADGQCYTAVGKAFGVVTGEERLVGIDLDCKNGVDGVAAMADLGWPIDDLDTLQADTPSVGVHLYVRWPDDLPIPKTTAGLVAHGVDIRGRGGLLRGIGSTTATGAYTVRRAAPIAECPRGLAELIIERTEPKKSKPEPRAKSFRRPKSHRAGRASLEALVQRMMDAEPGTRHAELISTATSAAKHHGVPGMRAVRMAAETTGLDADEIERTLADAAGYAGLDDAVMAAEEAMDVEDDDEDE